MRSDEVDGFVGVEVENERSYEAHLTARVLEDDLGIVGQTSQAVGRPHHRYVVHVHLGHAHHLRPTEPLHHTNYITPLLPLDRPLLTAQTTRPIQTFILYGSIMSSKLESDVCYRVPSTGGAIW